MRIVISSDNDCNTVDVGSISVREEVPVKRMEKTCLSSACVSDRSRKVRL